MWKRKTKINSSYSAFAEILLVAPLFLYCDLFLFSNYICNLFFKNEDFDIANYADDNTHACSSDPDSVIFKL